MNKPKEVTFTMEDYELYCDLLTVATWLRYLLHALSKKYRLRIIEKFEPSEYGPQVDNGLLVVFNSLLLRSMIKIITPWGSVDYCEGPKEIADIFNNLVAVAKRSFNGRYKVSSYDHSRLKKIIIRPIDGISTIRKEKDKVPRRIVFEQWQAMSEMNAMINK